MAFISCSYLAKCKDLHTTCILLILSTARDCISFSFSMHLNNCSFILGSDTNCYKPIEFVGSDTNCYKPIEFVGYFEGTKTS